MSASRDGVRDQVDSVKQGLFESLVHHAGGEEELAEKAADKGHLAGFLHDYNDQLPPGRKLSFSLREDIKEILTTSAAGGWRPQRDECAQSGGAPQLQRVPSEGGDMAGIPGEIAESEASVTPRSAVHAAAAAPAGRSFSTARNRAPRTGGAAPAAAPPADSSREHSPPQANGRQRAPSHSSPPAAPPSAVVPPPDLFTERFRDTQHVQQRETEVRLSLWHWHRMEYARVSWQLARSDGALGFGMESGKPVVKQVIPGGAAWRAGLRCGDAIISAAVCGRSARGSSAAHASVNTVKDWMDIISVLTVRAPQQKQRTGLLANYTIRVKYIRAAQGAPEGAEPEGGEAALETMSWPSPGAFAQAAQALLDSGAPSHRWQGLQPQRLQELLQGGFPRDRTPESRLSDADWEELARKAGEAIGCAEWVSEQSARRAVGRAAGSRREQLTVAEFRRCGLAELLTAALDEACAAHQSAYVPPPPPGQYRPPPPPPPPPPQPAAQKSPEPQLRPRAPSVPPEPREQLPGEVIVMRRAVHSVAGAEPWGLDVDADRLVRPPHMSTPAASYGLGEMGTIELTHVRGRPVRSREEALQELEAGDDETCEIRVLRRQGEQPDIRMSASPSPPRELLPPVTLQRAFAQGYGFALRPAGGELRLLKVVQGSAADTCTTEPSGVKLRDLEGAVRLVSVRVGESGAPQAVDGESPDAVQHIRDMLREHSSVVLHFEPAAHNDPAADPAAAGDQPAARGFSAVLRRRLQVWGLRFGPGRGARVRLVSVDEGSPAGKCKELREQLQNHQGEMELAEIDGQQVDNGDALREKMALAERTVTLRFRVVKDRRVPDSPLSRASPQHGGTRPPSPCASVGSRGSMTLVNDLRLRTDSPTHRSRYQPGRRVLVHPDVDCPAFGWGRVQHGDIGTLRKVEGDVVRVDFPAQSDWMAHIDEVMLAG